VSGWFNITTAPIQRWCRVLFLPPPSLSLSLSFSLSLSLCEARERETAVRVGYEGRARKRDVTGTTKSTRMVGATAVTAAAATAAASLLLVPPAHVNYT